MIDMFTIRRAGNEDIEAVIRLRLAFLQNVQPGAGPISPAHAEATRRYIEDKLPTGELLVWFAEEDGQILGTSGLVFFHRPPTLVNLSSVHGYVLNMYTAPAHRRRGVATALLEETIAYVKTTEARRVYLHASEMGRPVYARLGFEATDDEMVLKIP